MMTDTIALKNKTRVMIAGGQSRQASLPALAVTRTLLVSIIFLAYLVGAAAGTKFFLAVFSLHAEGLVAGASFVGGWLSLASMPVLVLVACSKPLRTLLRVVAILAAMMGVAAGLSV